MKRYNKITPEGTQDLIFEQCDIRDYITSRLSGLFRTSGFFKVQTPSLEFFDLFAASSGNFPAESMYKLTDTRGRLIVMRPDCTIPIARLADTKLKNLTLPIRLFYSQNVFRLSPEMMGKSNEINQIGIEVMGVRGEKPDLEVLQLAALSLRDCCQDQYRLELCHIGYFRAIIAALQADDATKEEIRSLIENKNYAALADCLANFEDCAATTALKALPGLFGGEEVFEKALQLFSSPEAIETLTYLKSIYNKLTQLGLGKQIMIDLGLVNQAEYYTGVIFRGYLQGIGEPVLSGGRYDNLVTIAGENIPSTGFGINVDQVANFLLAEGRVPPQQEADALVYSDYAHQVKALLYAQSLRERGKVAETCLLETPAQAKAYAQKRKIPQLHIISDEVLIQEVD